MKARPLTILTLLALTPLAAAQSQAGHDHAAMHPGADSAEKAMKARGTAIMGVDQDRSTHRFTSLPDGGRIELTSNEEDSAATVRIRKHFGDIEKAFAAGDFSIPAMVHDQDVPGTDRAAREAIHRFLLFQRTEHHAGQ